MIKRPKTASSKEEAAKRATESTPVDPVAGKSVAEIFGEIVWLMSQDKDARELSIRDLEWLVMPPILLRQFHITYAPLPVGQTVRGDPVRSSGAKPPLQPVAVELFAMVSPAVAAALDAVPQSKMALTLQDWRSGTERRIIATYKIQGSG